MLRRCRRLFTDRGFVPASIQHLPDFPRPVGDIEATGAGGGLVPQRQRETPEAMAKRKKGYKPLSLKARIDLSEMSDDKSYHRVTPEWFGMRLDDFLVQHYGSQYDYDTIIKLVQQGHIYRYKHNGRRTYTRVSDRLELDELVVVPTTAHWEKQIAPPTGVMDDKPERPDFVLSKKLKEEAMSWTLFKNEHVVCINKPYGVPMNGGTGIGMNISDMLSAWKYTYTTKPIICNYLDRETSGVVILARTPNVHRQLGRMFMKRVTPNNVYWGYMVGNPTAKFGRLKMHLEVEKHKGGEIITGRAFATPNSKVAITEYVTNMKTGEYGCWISFYPLTSHKHQLRILAAHALRCPILGDGKYGGEASFSQSFKTFLNYEKKEIPLHLHHRKIQLPYKKANGEFITVTAPLPPHMQKTFEKMGLHPDIDDPLIPG